MKIKLYLDDHELETIKGLIYKHNRKAMVIYMTKRENSVQRHCVTLNVPQLKLTTENKKILLNTKLKKEN